MKARPSSLLRTNIVSLPPSPHPRPPPSTTRPSSTFTTPSQISAYLAHPTWSVRDTLLSPPPPPPPHPAPTSSPSPNPSTPDNEITTDKLHHLLRLSALPLPRTPAAQTGLLDDLRRQLRFVQAIQGVDTWGVEPLVAIRDETGGGVKEREVGMGDVEIVAALGGERGVGRRGRVVSVGMRGRGEGKGEEEEEARTRSSSLQPILVDDGHGGKWDPLARAGRRVGRYIAVDTARD